MKAINNLTSLEEFTTQHYGPKGTVKRNEFEEGYENFKLGFMLQEARKKAGLTQDKFAQKAGTTKSYISKIENNIKEVRLSTLQKIVERGLGGKVELSIKLDEGS